MMLRAWLAMNPLVDHRTIFDTWRNGPAAVIRLFEDANGQICRLGAAHS